MTTTRTLSEVMDFDHPVRVDADGDVSDAHGIYAPELIDDELMGDDWELLDGYSMQDGYSGPIMHPSEFIGGRLADDILSTPGVYVALVAYCSDSDEPEGWAVARMLHTCDHCGEPDPTGFDCCQDCADSLAAEREAGTL